MKLQLYQVVHVLGGVLIGAAGIHGIPFALIVLWRERWQETETEGTKAKTNIAWKDMTEWATGAAIGTVLRLGGVWPGIVEALVRTTD